MPRPRAAVAPAPPAPLLPPAAPEHPADRAVRLRDKAGLPADQHAGYDAVVAGFARYEAGDDEGARAALQAIGLGSPFAEWKLLLRGLLAYSAGDDARAVENWRRLAPGRLPFVLAAPVRVAIDPAFAQDAGPAAAAYRRQFEVLTADGVTDALRSLRADLSRDKPLTAAFRKAETLLATLRRHAPHLAPRLANGFYRAILHHGEPGDLPRFRKLFGSPPDDPDFHRLQAQVYEDGKNVDEAVKHWTAYEAWLAKDPPGWPADVTRRARALILYRLGTLAGKQADDPHRELRDMVESMFGGPQPRRKTGSTEDPATFWRKAAALAPGWEPPARELFLRLAAQGKADEAEAIARTLLAHNPAAVPVLDALAGLLAQKGRAADALDLRTKALAANPLDKRLRVQAAYGHLAAARRLAVDGDPSAADAALDAGREVCAAETPAGYYALRSVLALKAKQPDAAADHRAKAAAVPGGRLAVALFAAVDAVLVKLKPADRKPLDQSLAAALAGPATPLEANLLYAAWDQYQLEGLEYRGQKTQEKKVHDVILRTPAADAPAFDFETLANGVAARHEWKLVGKLTPPLRAKFHGNPVFPLLLAESEFDKADGRPAPYRVTGLLREAKAAAERSPEPRHKDLLDRIRTLERQGAYPMDFGDLFGEDD